MEIEPKPTGDAPLPVSLGYTGPFRAGHFRTDHITRFGHVARFNLSLDLETASTSLRRGRVRRSRTDAISQCLHATVTSTLSTAPGGRCVMPTVNPLTVSCFRVIAAPPRALPASLPRIKSYRKRGIHMLDGTGVFERPGQWLRCAAMPQRDLTARPHLDLVSGEPADPVNPPPGCAFASRCPVVVAECHENVPRLRPIADAHRAACMRL